MNKIYDPICKRDLVQLFSFFSIEIFFLKCLVRLHGAGFMEQVQSGFMEQVSWSRFKAASWSRFNRLFSIYVKKQKIHFLSILEKVENLGKTVEYDKTDVKFVISDLDYPLLGIFRKNFFC